MEETLSQVSGVAQAARRQHRFVDFTTQVIKSRSEQPPQENWAAVKSPSSGRAGTASCQLPQCALRLS